MTCPDCKTPLLVCTGGFFCRTCWKHFATAGAEIRNTHREAQEPSQETPQSAETAVRAKRGNKYGAVKTVVAGVTFDSKKEARRYEELTLMQAAGEIENLEVHPAWSLDIEGVHIGRYTADFCYETDEGFTVEDCKGVRTRDYLLRKKLMLALHGIEIKET